MCNGLYSLPIRWFADESGFEGDPRPRKRWDKKGSKTRVTKNGGHLRMNAVCLKVPQAKRLEAYPYGAFLYPLDHQLLCS